MKKKKSSIHDPVQIYPSDLWTLVLCYVRYAMGRMSTAPSSASDFVKIYWPDFEKHQQEQILREVEQELNRAERNGELLGHKCDDDTWRELLAWMRIKVREHAGQG